MDVKEAVRAAKEYVNEVFAGENVRHVSLEEPVPEYVVTFIPLPFFGWGAARFR